MINKPGPFPLTYRQCGESYIVETNQGNLYANTYSLSAARMIASAPGMLNAIKLAHDALENHLGDESSTTLDEKAMDSMRIAIMKAEGK